MVLWLSPPLCCTAWMMRKTNLTLIGVLAVLAFVFTLGASQVKGEDKPKTLTFAMPACPIKATTVPPTKIGFMLPTKNPLRVPFSVVGTVQVADQSGGVIFKTSNTVAADLTQVAFSRTVNTIQHLTGSLTFDRGCRSTDPYGSNTCAWTWGESITAGFGGALQEDITSGKLVVDLKIDNTIPFAFSCPVCGATCTITIPEQVDDGNWNEMWVLMFGLIRFPLALTNVFPH
ncbi:exported hypothetical protein [Candidatus Sulfopaludibacter sp. SbA4]|nr:exported hypothetical protein [Candidatus Sulfopaludibacter sp. SbA4]